MAKHSIINKFVYGNIYNGDKKIAYQNICGRLFYITEDYDISRIEETLAKRNGEYIIKNGRGRRLATITIEKGVEY